MTLAELIDQSKIEEIYSYIWNQPIRGHRARACWRNGDSLLSVLFHPEKNTFWDFKMNEGGGLLDLISLSENITKAQAVVWLESYHGVNLDKDQGYNHAEMKSAQAWREAAIIAEEKMIETCDRLKEENDRRFGALSNWKNWKTLCGQQKDCRKEIERLRELKGKDLLAAYGAVPMKDLLELSVQAETIKAARKADEYIQAYDNARRVCGPEDRWLVDAAQKAAEQAMRGLKGGLTA